MGKIFLTLILVFSVTTGTLLANQMICMEQSKPVASHCDMDSKSTNCPMKGKASSCFCLNIILPAVTLTKATQLFWTPLISQISYIHFNQVVRYEQPPLQPPTV